MPNNAEQNQNQSRNPFVPNVHFELIPAKNLLSDQEYQRNLSEKHVNKAADNFDVYQINPVKVSRRNGVNYVFDGQHTIEIITKVSGSKDTPVWCMIYDDLVYEREADIFANQMKYKKALLPYEIFKANIEAGNEKQLAIKQLVESYDLEISPQQLPGRICAVSTLEKIYDNMGLKVLDRVLRLCVGTWEGAPQSFSSSMLNGVARVVVAYGDSLKDDTFKDKLEKVSLKELTRTAKDRRAGSLGFAEAIITFYNKRNHSALSMEKLYAKTNKKPEKPDIPPAEKTESETPENNIVALGA